MNLFRIVAPVTILILFSFAVSLHAASPPKTISYQGYLKDAAGRPVTAATNMTFSLYSSTSGVNPVWTSTPVNVTPTNGVYIVQMGSSPQPALPTFDHQYYLGVTAGTGPEMRPLQPLSSVPFAFHAAVAENACQSALKIDPPSASKIDPPQAVVFSY